MKPRSYAVNPGNGEVNFDLDVGSLFLTMSVEALEVIQGFSPSQYLAAWGILEVSLA